MEHKWTDATMRCDFSASCEPGPLAITAKIDGLVVEQPVENFAIPGYFVREFFHLADACRGNELIISRLERHAETLEARNRDLERGLEKISEAQEWFRRFLETQEGRALAERARIREELLAVLEKEKWPDTLPPGHEESGQRLKWAVHVDVVLAALDRACPAQETTSPSTTSST